MKKSKTNSINYAKISIILFTTLFTGCVGSVILLQILGVLTSEILIFISSSGSAILTALIQIARKRSDDDDPQVLDGTDTPMGTEETPFTDTNMISSEDNNSWY